MQTPDSDSILITVDRAAAELLWSVNQLTAQPLPSSTRQRAVEILSTVIDGLRFHHNQLNPLSKELQS